MDKLLTYKFESCEHHAGCIATINEVPGAFGYGETRDVALLEASFLAARILYNQNKASNKLLDAARLAVANFEQWRASDGDAGVAIQMIAAMERLGKAVDEVHQAGLAEMVKINQETG